MKNRICYLNARDRLLELAVPVGVEPVPLENCRGRVLAFDFAAGEDVPSFARSAFDGYALRSEDSLPASSERPVTLKLLEEVRAGKVPSCTVTSGTAVKILTGAPIPQGADAVIPYEKTLYTAETVTLRSAVREGENVIPAGEDMQTSRLLATRGTVIDAGLAGVLAAQGVTDPAVYLRPNIGLISTGDELVEPGETVPQGALRNSSRYLLAAALEEMGCRPVYLGLAGDRMEVIADRIADGISRCDAVLLTGGVSAGDYDLTPAGMRMSGVEIFVQGVDMKPGMACAYGVKDGRLVCGLSGNPAAAVTNFYAVVCPAIRRMCGRKDPIPEEILVTLRDAFPRSSRSTRLLRGRLDLSEGVAGMRLPSAQGNAVISSSAGCNVIAVVPAGSGPIPAGTVLKGFLPNGV